MVKHTKKRVKVVISLDKNVLKKLREIKNENGTPISQMLEKSFLKTYGVKDE